METQVLKVVGQIAGIGGLALGVLFLLYRDALRLKIFPKLPPDLGYRLIRLIVVLVFVVALVGIGAWVWTTTGGGRSVQAGGGGVAVGGDVSGSTINAAGAPAGR